MVFFSCNVCGEALKKNQVDKHCMTKCRSCQSVCCIDCGKDFWGNDYENHTKCISEDQKYSGKGYVPKVNKGEAKQDRWIEQVQIAIDKHKNNPRLRGPLESIKNYPNIPRKKAKFENFLLNSLRIRDRSLVSLLWDAIMEEAAKNMKPVETQPPNKQTNGNKEENGQDDKETEDSNDVKEEKTLSKREKKEERRKKMNKKEKKDKSVEFEENETKEKNGKVSKKGKKRKHEEEEEEEEEEDNSKKRKNEDDEEEEEAPVMKKTKFNWENVITEVLTSKGEISVKKLKKKVLSEYVSQMGEPRSEEKLWSKFDKKLSKNPSFKVLKERVKLAVQT